MKSKTKFEFLFMTRRQWWISFCIAVVIAIVTYPLYESVSLWFGFGVIMAILLLINMSIASQSCIPIPQIAGFVAISQFLLAPWVAWYYPTYHSEYDIGWNISVYLSYAGPMCIAFLVGLFMPIVVADSPLNRQTVYDTGKQRQCVRAQVFKRLVFIGISATLVDSYVWMPGSLQFFVVLIGGFRYVGSFGLILLRVPGWKVYVAAVAFLEIILAISGGMFHSLVIWGTYLLFFLAYKQHWGKRMLVILLSGIIFLYIVQVAKYDYRDQFWYGNVQSSGSPPAAFSGMIWRHVSDPLETFSSYNISRVAMRMNQGWIINQTMLWTPQMEPFAHGGTLLSTVVENLIPRFIMPDKFNPRDLFERFTGHRLIETSMGLGYAGEMYANFGSWGGVFAVGLYAFFLGLFYRWFYLRALQEPLWWVWAAYVLFAAVKAESSLGLVVNWVVKAAFVMVIVLWFSPTMKKMLFPRFRIQKT